VGGQSKRSRGLSEADSWVVVREIGGFAGVRSQSVISTNGHCFGGEEEIEKPRVK